MSNIRKRGAVAVSVVFAGVLAISMTGSAFAHCDSTSGPVITEAQAALEKGDVTPVLKWVGLQDEAEIKAAFARSMTVRGQGAEARELADRYFLETLVRLHRAGEGAPYTGITDEPVPHVIVMADGALAAGSADDMIGHIGEHLAKAIREKFDRAAAAAAHQRESVEAGREFVAAYVTYVHYVEGIHAAMMAGGHHGEAAAKDSAHAH